MSLKDYNTIVLFTWEVNDRLKGYLKDNLENTPKKPSSQS